MTNAHAVARRKVLVALACAQLAIIASILGGLCAVIWIFGVRDCDLLREEEIAGYRESPPLPYDASSPAAEGHEVVPRIMHWTTQTTIPERWTEVNEGCRAMHPTYEHRVWSDEAARQLIADRYAWFLPTYDGYAYAIQRADALRYFVLYEYGGVYLDLDVGCVQSVDPLLNYEVVLPQTRPVGISNDVLVASPRHPFFAAVIESLATFDHSFGTKYATVMFSSGPMFLSAVYGAFTQSTSAVRILPRPLYGKYAKADDRSRVLFKHYFASSWHGNDAGLVFFINRYGLMIVGMAAALTALALLRHFIVTQCQRQRPAIVLDDEKLAFLPPSPCYRDEKTPTSADSNLTLPLLGSRSRSTSINMGYTPAPSPSPLSKRD